MHCFFHGAATQPPSSDPCTMWLGPGIISIMCSIYSAASDLGPWRERSTRRRNHTGPSSKSCRIGEANSWMKPSWYVCTHIPVCLAAHHLPRELNRTQYTANWTHNKIFFLNTFLFMKSEPGKSCFYVRILKNASASYDCHYQNIYSTHPVYT